MERHIDARLNMMRHIGSVTLLAIGTGVVAGLAAFAVVSAFHEAIETAAEMARNGQYLGRRAGPTTLLLIVGAVVGWWAGVAKQKMTGMVGFVVDVPFALVAAGTAYAVSMALSVSALPLDSELASLSCQVAAVGLAGGFGVKMWREEYC